MIKFKYTGIRVKDLEKSLKFYTEILGMEIVLREKTKHGEFAHLKSPESYQILEINWYNTESKYFTEYKNGEELDHLGFQVENVRKTFEELVKKGVKIIEGIFETNGYEIFYIEDPNGIWIEIFGKKKQ